MRALSTSAILDLSDDCIALHPVDRALAFLSAALPGERWEDLAALDVGERDALLLELRERTFGSSLESDARCPYCSERLEFTLSTRELRRRPSPDSTPAKSIEIDGIRHRFRLPDSFDLAAVAGCSGSDEARRMIAERCLQRPEALDSEARELGEESIALLSSLMSECDPCIDITLDLTCPACEGRWEMIFDITSWLWIEIRDEARRLLRDVDTLARAYGWSESEILGLSSARRQRYLEMVG